MSDTVTLAAEHHAQIVNLIKAVAALVAVCTGVLLIAIWWAVLDITDEIRRRKP